MQSLEFFLTFCLLVSPLTDCRVFDPAISETIERDDLHRDYPDPDGRDEVPDGTMGDVLPDFGGMRPVDVESGVFPHSDEMIPESDFSRRKRAVESMPIGNDGTGLLTGQMGQQIPPGPPAPVPMQHFAMRDRSLEQYLMEQTDNKVAELSLQIKQTNESLKKIESSLSSACLFLFFILMFALTVDALVAYFGSTIVAFARKIYLKIEQAEKDAESATTAQQASGHRLGTA